MIEDREARDTLVITRGGDREADRFQLRARAAGASAARGTPGRVTLVDKANVFRSFAFMRQVFDERGARDTPTSRPRHHYVDAMALDLVRRPWDFDVLPTENLFGDILSDLGAGLIGGMGFAPSADIGDEHAAVPAEPRHRPGHRRQGHRQPDAR